MDLFYIAAVLMAGLCLGSFATAAAYRLPREISLLKKVRSACPSCQHSLGFFDLFPVLSWIFLKGRCRYCKAEIGVRYLAVELVTAALCLIFYQQKGWTAELLPYLALAPVLVSLAAIDFEYKILPDSLNFAAFLFGVAAQFFANDFAGGILGAVLYAGTALILRWAFFKLKKREGLGLGDVKFLAVVGVWLGADPSRAAMFMIVAGLLGVVLALVWKKIKGEAEFPFGPALITSFVATLLFF